ncbi:TPA: hypothetical protein RFU01_000001 [Klebsiella variicola]|nr:hypothetical protein [Klebsiella variicola]
MRAIIILLLSIALSGCDFFKTDFTVEEAGKRAILGELQIKVGDLRNGDIDIIDGSHVYVTYTNKYGTQIMKKIFITMKDGIKPNDIMHIPIPDFGYTLGDIHICFYYKKEVNERMTYEVFLPIYEYNEFQMSATKGFKFYRNNNEMLYKQPFEFYVKPNLKLDGLHGFINKDFPIGSGLSSV